MLSKAMYKFGASYVSCRAGVYYYTRRVPYDVKHHYSSNRLSFSLRTKSNSGALRAAQSVYLGAILTHYLHLFPFASKSNYCTDFYIKYLYLIVRKNASV